MCVLGFLYLPTYLYYANTSYNKTSNNVAIFSLFPLSNRSLSRFIVIVCMHTRFGHIMVTTVLQQSFAITVGYHGILEEILAFFSITLLVVHVLEHFGYFPKENLLVTLL